MIGLPEFLQPAAEVVVEVRQGFTEVDDGRIVINAFLKNRQRLAVIGQRLVWLGIIPQQDTERLVTTREPEDEVGNGGVVVGESLIDRQRLAEFGLRFCAAYRSSPATCRSWCGYLRGRSGNP